MGLLDTLFKKQEPKGPAQQHVQNNPVNLTNVANQANQNTQAGVIDEIKEEESAVAEFSEGIVDVKDIIAPPAIEIDFNHLQIGSKYFRTFFATGFPRWVGANWLAPLINFEKKSLLF